MKKVIWIGILSLMVGFFACNRDVERQRILKVYGADWSEDGRVLVLGRFTDVRVTYGWLWGASYDTLKNQDVMLWVDPVSRAVDSVWVIHEPGEVLPQGSDFWRDPKGRGWWVSGYQFLRLFSADFLQVQKEFPCITYVRAAMSLSGDSVIFTCVDTLRVYDIVRDTLEEILEYPYSSFLFFAQRGGDGKFYMGVGDPEFTDYHYITRWEGGDSFTVVDSPAIYFGFKQDTLVVMYRSRFYLHYGDSIVDTLHWEGKQWSGASGNCSSLWKWHGRNAIRCIEADVVICNPKDTTQEVLQCSPYWHWAY